MSNRDNNSYDQRNTGRDEHGEFDERGGRDDPEEGGEEGENDRSNLMPEARFRGRRIDHALAWAGKGAKRKEQLAVQFEFTTPEVKGRTMTWYGYFTDKTTESTLKAMRTMGWKGNDPTSGWPDPASKDNPEVELVIQHERNQNNRWIARIRWVNGGGIAVRDVMNEADKANFAQRLTGIAARLAAKDGGDGGGGGNDRQLADPRGQRDDRGVPPPSDDDQPPFQRGRNGGGRGGNGRNDRW